MAEHGVFVLSKPTSKPIVTHALEWMASARERIRAQESKTQSLENKMACGIGACLCCVENTTKGNVCVCKEGPVFNIKKLQW